MEAYAESLYQHGQSLFNFSEIGGPQNVVKMWEVFPKQLNILYYNLGLSEKGKVFIENTLPIISSYYGENNIVTLKSQNMLLIYLSQLGDHERVLSLCKKIISQIKPQLNAFHMQFHIDTLLNLSACLEFTGMYTEIEHLRRGILDDIISLKKTYKDYDVALAQRNLAVTLEDLGRSEEAEILYRNALTTAILRYGKNHIKVAEIQCSLSNTLRSLGKCDEAKILANEALLIANLHYRTVNHIRVADIQNNLANILFSLGSYEEAEKLYETALTATISHYGSKDHIKVTVIEQNIAVMLSYKRKFDRAYELNKKILKIITHHYGETHIRAIEVKENIASNLCSLENYIQAETVCKEVIEGKIQIYGKNHIKTATAQQTLSTILINFNSFEKYEEVKVLRENSLTIMISYYGKYHIKVSRQHKLLANVLQRLGDYKQAELHYQQALKILKDNYHSSYVDIALAQFDLSGIQYFLKKFHSSSGFLDNCEKTLKEQASRGQYVIFVQDFRESVIVELNELFFSSYEEDLYDEVVDILKGLIFFDSDSKKRHTHNLACAYHFLGIKTNIKTCFYKAEKFFKKAIEYPDSLNVKVEYAIFLRSCERYNDALMYLEEVLCAQDYFGDTLSYGVKEAVVLPFHLRQEVSQKKRIEIDCVHFFAHYLKIVCLLEKPTFKYYIISASLENFSDFVRTFRENHTEDFLPIYDWFLQNARELANQSAAICIQRFFRGHVTRKDSNEKELRLNPQGVEYHV